VKLTDILPIEKWAELEEDIYNRCGLDVSVFGTDGMSITEFKRWANRLCPAVKANKKGQTFICAVANQNLTREAWKTRQPVIGECDAGLGKLVVPIFVGDEFLGAAGGCGMIIDGSEVESFLISKMTGIDEERIENLSKDIYRIPTNEAETLVEYIKEEIHRIVSDFERNRK
jgi:ligand-binding sensor protein